MFNGPSAHYLKQQFDLALKPLGPLRKIDPRAELQLIDALGAALLARREIVADLARQAQVFEDTEAARAKPVVD